MVAVERNAMSQPTFTTTGPGYSEIGHSYPPAELEDGDALLGGAAIQQFRNRLLGTKTSLSATFKQLERGQIPAQRIPGGWLASKRGLRRHYARGTGLAA
jgi:hypothetical protein